MFNLYVARVKSSRCHQIEAGNNPFIRKSVVYTVEVCIAVMKLAAQRSHNLLAMDPVITLFFYFNKESTPHSIAACPYSKLDPIFIPNTPELFSIAFFYLYIDGN